MLYRPGAQIMLDGREYVMRDDETSDEFARRTGLRLTKPDDLRGQITHRNQVMTSLKENPTTRDAFIHVYSEALKKKAKSFAFMGVTFDWEMAHTLLTELYPGAEIVDGRPLI